jgi:Protein of unknown function (DUF2568)
MIINILKNVNLALAFLLELGVLAALGYWGFQVGQGTLIKIALAIGAPIVAVVVWMCFGAPRATWHLQGIWLFILRVIFFGAAVVALFFASQRVLGVIFALLFVINLVLIYVWKQ